MVESINEKLERLENTIKTLQSKLDDISLNVEESTSVPYSKVGGGRDRSQIRPVDLSASAGQMFGGNIVWNDSELKLPPYGQKPDEPIKGYNKHAHSRYAGGALDLNSLEIVEYDVDWDTDANYNKHCQQFWVGTPNIKTMSTTGDTPTTVKKIGNLDLIFNPDTMKWGSVAYEIDVEKTFLVRRDPTDATKYLKDDDGNDMKAPLFNDTAIAGGGTDSSKSNVVWDSKAKVFRFYAIYADEDAV